MFCQRTTSYTSLAGNQRGWTCMSCFLQGSRNWYPHSVCRLCRVINYAAMSLSPSAAQKDDHGEFFDDELCWMDQFVTHYKQLVSGRMVVGRWWAITFYVNWLARTICRHQSQLGGGGYHCHSRSHKWCAQSLGGVLHLVLTTIVIFYVW